MRALAWAGVVFGVAAMVAALVLFSVAIWTVGPDSGRIAATGALIMIPGFAITFASLSWLGLSS